MAGNKAGHSNAVHASIYARQYRKATKHMIDTGAQLTMEEREALSAPVPLRKGHKRK